MAGNPQNVRNLFAQKIRRLREKKKMTQSQVAKELGVALTTVSGWETERKQPDLDMLEKIADFYDLSVSELLNDGAENSELARVDSEAAFIRRVAEISASPFVNKIDITDIDEIREHGDEIDYEIRISLRYCEAVGMSFYLPPQDLVKRCKSAVTLAGIVRDGVIDWPTYCATINAIVAQAKNVPSFDGDEYIADTKNYFIPNDVDPDELPF